LSIHNTARKNRLFAPEPDGPAQKPFKTIGRRVLSGIRLIAKREIAADNQQHFLSDTFYKVSTT
jgi:hypothetical protein